MSKYHEISDSASDSDSDATIEPPDPSSFLNGSQDLFDSSTASCKTSLKQTHSRSSSNSSPSDNRNTSASPVALGSKSKHLKSSKPSPSKAVSLTKKVSSRSHEISDSDSEPATDCQGHSSHKSSKAESPVQNNSSAVTSYGQYNSNAASSSGHSHSSLSGSSKSECKYGSRCYRTNPQHYQEFSHEGQKRKSPADGDRGEFVSTAKKKSRTPVDHNARSFAKTVVDVFTEFQPLSLFLTKVRGIDDRFNNTGAVSIQGILSPLMGNLEASCQFNYMFDIPWLMQQYPKQFRDKPVLIVHGEQGREEAALKDEASSYPNVSFCRAKLEMIYGTHHTKMMLLLYDCGMRVVIHTANIVSDDWDQKTQGVWISPLFPKLNDKASATSKTIVGDSTTNFKRDLLAYLAAYKAVPLTQWERHIQQHDMSAARVYIVGSVPGRHSGNAKFSWGHMRLRKLFQEAGPEKSEVGSWTMLGQFSSIGSLGASPEQWLCSEWLSSLSQCRGSMSTPLPANKLQLVYPSKENVRLCLEGYAGGGCLPYSIKTAQKQIYLNNFVRKWGSEGRGRTVAIPHIKTYTRVSPDYSQAAWFLVTSANLSKAAWGALEKQNSQLMIRSYEIGVLFLPQHFDCKGSFPIATTAEDVCESGGIKLPFPYDLPPPTYQKGDRTWMWDVPCVDLPDTHGKKYCPRL